ncbi:MAG: tRNA preQ1(34) S-adenosylmethionine ribosyltransferase-isomerase QueA [bacterium]|jgi:S-adenosylmethionine:tRNA ribosyltransferase-isomerase|nr:tRNA preQ1(34) S-adenosylmethionine ribosyltransferase-isomerase QueA [Candidatus Neomarinimicrobiota bacterium]MDX9780108.1 tRNA preQ1(34) S-adenosylmethionine ribosyltransferase-isomerase QueA [bacterium]
MTKFEIFNTQPKAFRLSDFDFELPKERIAQYPSDKRGEDRLMVVDRSKNSFSHHRFAELPLFLKSGDCLAFNNTKVFPARLFAFKDKSDSEVEVFLLRELEEQIWEVLVKPARKVRIGNKLHFNDKIYADVIDNTISGGRVIRHNCSKSVFMKYVMNSGKSPLPPYIRRESEPIDKERYQTVFAKELGAVAAPTAGLHFTEELFETITQKGVKLAPLTLHIGLGTFRSVQVEDLRRHQMDSEYFKIPKKTATTINLTKEHGGRIVAVGTSTVRSLESSLVSGSDVNPKNTWTDKFIYPPYEFQVVDCLVTNFHQPRSTLIMMVSAFAGHDLIMEAYTEAIKEKYNFYSYGDAMLIL